MKAAAHITGWLLLFGLLIGFVSVSQRGEEASGFPYIRPSVLLYLAIWIAVFYTNANLLIPRLYLHKRYIAYFGILLMLLLAVYYFKPFEHLVAPKGRPPLPSHFPPVPRPGMEHFPHMPRPPHEPRTDIISIILLVMVCALSFGLEILKEWRRSERRVVQAEADKANAELSFIKAQINPHFLFNTLNNIYAMAVTGHEQTAPSIMKLSQIMRFITDNTTKEEVPLQQVVSCMTDLVDLHRLRFNKKATIDYSVKGNLEEKQISPFVLITFVENTFKYGVSSHEESPITIHLEANNNTLSFYCRNRIFPQNRTTESTGIGINNTRKRLAFLYPERHSLNIQTDNGWFTVQLEIRL